MSILPAYGEHLDGKRVTGEVFKLRGATIYCQSFNQKIVSSSEFNWGWISRDWWGN